MAEEASPEPSLPRDGPNILDLLMPMLSGSKDDYGSEEIPPLPLTFDRVNEGRPPSTGSTLFKLPMEILSNILLHIPQDSLASLALVNSDCRQLARSRQFCSVCLNYSNAGLQLMQLLLDELQERLDNNGRTRRPSLGACIRRLTVATSSAWVELRHGLKFKETQKLSQEERDLLLDKASDLFFDRYIPLIQRILPSLPHLQLLDWEDMIEVGEGFFEALVQSRFQHLKLFRISVTKEVQANIGKILPAQGWNLRGLHLELYSAFRIRPEERPALLPLSVSLLRVCAETLESLTWILDDDPTVRDQASADWDLTMPPFRKLRDLTLQTGRPYWFPDSTALHALIPPDDQCSLRSLSIDPTDPVISEFLNQRGKILSLESLDWQDPMGNSPIDFVLANDRLAKLSMDFPTSSELLGSKLLPSLSHSFTKLISLRLTWKENFIPRKSLEIISSLKGLEQICLSAGEQSGWRHDWLIDHQAMRETFSQLPNLKRFAFPRDTYHSAEIGTPVERYYLETYTPEVMNHPEVADYFSHDTMVGNTNIRENFRDLCKRIWEDLHRERMLSEAQNYLRELPDHPLEWMYFGQIPIGVKSVSGHKLAYPLFHERDDCYTLLQKMFTWGTYDLTDAS